MFYSTCKIPPLNFVLVCCCTSSLPQRT